MIHSIHIGDERRYKRIITQTDVKRFGEVSGDMNPIHFDEHYASRTVFKKPIVHGMLVGSLFSKLFGMYYPDAGMIYLSQSLKFIKPVYPDTELDIVVRVKEVILEKNRVIFQTDIYGDAEQLLLTGEAIMMPPKAKDSNE